MLLWLQKQGSRELVSVSTITLSSYYSAFQLTHFAAVDEPLWMEDRIPKFWKNLGEGDLDKTNISDKPGITVTYATDPASSLPIQKILTTRAKSILPKILTPISKKHVPGFPFHRGTYRHYTFLPFSIFCLFLFWEKKASFCLCLLPSPSSLIGMSKIKS